MFVSTGTCNAKMHNLSAFKQCINIIFAYNFKIKEVKVTSFSIHQINLKIKVIKMPKIS